MTDNMPSDRVFVVALVIPGECVDLMDEDMNVDSAIEFAHRYMHEAGAGEAPYLRALR